MASSQLFGHSFAGAANLHRVPPPNSSSFAFLKPSSLSILTWQRHRATTTNLSVLTMAKKKTEETAVTQIGGKSQEEVDEEVEEDLPWIQDKAMDLVEFTGSVTQAIPGPRVGSSSFPWMLALPLAYVGITFVTVFVKTVRKFNSSKEKKKKLVNKNALLCKSIDELFKKGRDTQHSSLKVLMQKTGFDMEEILRKYIRYAMNERPFNGDLVADLIQLRKASMLDDATVAGILNEISGRIVRDKGPVVMDVSGYTEKGLNRKLAVQALFGKVFYLSELPDFCSRDSSLVVKEIFGVTDDDVDTLRINTFSESGDMDSIQKMMDGSDPEHSIEGSSNGLQDELKLCNPTPAPWLYFTLEFGVCGTRPKVLACGLEFGYVLVEVLGMAGREVREYTNLTDPKDRKLGKGKDKIDDEDITFHRMVAKMQEVSGERGGYLHGRGALDSDDLLYLKEQMEAEEDAERLLRRTEKRAHKAASLVDSSPVLVPLPLRLESKPKSGIRQQDLLKNIVEIRPKRPKVSSESSLNCGTAPVSTASTSMSGKKELVPDKEIHPSRLSKGEVDSKPENPLNSLLGLSYEASDDEED
ncbi:hypothetical protein NE237_006110 [Protea cynaroides]|uniref:Armadillo-like repeats domain-containing protein n=1 Tax=Protea cynaroides TaxID=273540 RepID=A0A9Q0KMJ2_9MAGN|nr:hypothetical protein NE237_006110 [Protea cynaroides]